MPKHREPPAWAFTDHDQYRRRSGTNVIGLATRKEFPSIRGVIERQGVNADGHSWYFVTRIFSWVLYATPGEPRPTQVGAYNIKPVDGEFEPDREEIDDAIVEVAPNLASARVKLLTRAEKGNDVFVYDWIEVSIRPQRHRRYSVGEAVFRAIKLWHTLPKFSGDTLSSRDKFFNSYDSSFRGLQD